MFLVRKPLSKLIYAALAAVTVWLGIKYALPVALPFLLGGVVAVAAEPVAGLLNRKLSAPRALASAVAVTMVLLLLVGAAVTLLALMVNQAGRLSTVLPELTRAIGGGLGSLESWLLTLAEKAPGEVRTVLTDGVVSLFSGSSTVMEQAVSRILGMASQILGAVTDGALGLATGVLAAYMLSIRLPKLKRLLGDFLPEVWRQRYLPALKGLKGAALGWLTAQLKLSGVTLGLLLIGFWVLQIPYAPVWAVVIALVDAFPILGCGTVLLPWSLICLLQQQQTRGIGLLGIWVLTWLIRSVLEPRLLGKELGLDPLVTLISIYAGLKLFGIVGMVLAPLLAMLVIRLLRSPETGR